VLLRGVGAVLIQGAKAVGKTATAQRHSVRTVRPDRAATAAVVAADPGAAIRTRRMRPLAISERLDADGRAGATNRCSDGIAVIPAAMLVP
jgi:hypothetical protein